MTFLSFVLDVSFRGVHKRFFVHNVSADLVLGLVTYSFVWHKYVFEPDDDLMFSVGCLSEIIAFINGLECV